MTRPRTTPLFRREREAHPRSPLAEMLFSARRYLARMSAADVAALLLVWGNILGLIAYPALARGHSTNQLQAQSVEAPRHPESR